MVSDTIALVGKAVDLVQQLRGIAQKVKDAESQNLIADLMISLADIKIQVAELKGENLDLRTQLASHENRKAEADKFEQVGNVLYQRTDTEHKQPYCPRCFQVDHREMTLTKVKPPFNDFGNWKCAQCDKNF
ncbi:MAG: hypothetical protein ACR2FY_15080 [Pirellulaceae bacterium]